MGSGSGDDRRRAPRHVPARSLGVEAETESLERIEGEAHDVSSGGACLALGADLMVGEDVILRLHFLEPDRSVLATGRIVWMTSRLWGRPRYGVQWTFPAPKRYWVDYLSRS
jgi:hypothetical protein